MLPEAAPAFSSLPLPALHYGSGSFSRIAPIAAQYGRRVLLLTGKSALERSGHLERLLDGFASAGMSASRFIVEREPSPEMVDRAVGLHGDADVVVAVGGGSVLDAGKAVSAMLPSGEGVEPFIEGRPGFREHDGRKVPFIAVPTTSGTGSEATSNSVISRVGREGFKRSLRHAAFVPEVAILEPALMTSASRELTAASGMDACTQLVEALTSPFATPFTDACALEGLRAFSRSFMAACGEGAGSEKVRGAVAWGAFLSGAALTNAGLGIVHGFASSLGAVIDIPHGTLCATLLEPATRQNVAMLRELDADHPALVKYGRAGRILGGRDEETGGVAEGIALLLETLQRWEEELGFPRLSAYGLEASALDGVVAATRGRSNPVPLRAESMKKILLERL